MEETSERRTNYYVYGPEPVRPRFERLPEKDTGGGRGRELTWR